MINDKQGGPAFPFIFDDETTPGITKRQIYPGITIRDYFAAKALAGMHARDTFDDGQSTPGQRAALAYIDADAMLKERAK